ncbi:hypothetical protein QYE76_010707 [Lolium multiflorum]|uniref:Reverse transcriptase Ty1/copia-type domain-containing protein n=1 Tax=Lolium multiflorum TaxID=4521 RepID=A0AAD8X3C9_LOLMU|nr:hypothetical protein QYE76_010707 [Lolium multiflorum]
MQEEYDALQRNRTWELVPRPPRANVITGKWVFKHKLGSDGTLERYKAGWVVRGFRQHAGVEFTDMFDPVVKPDTIRTVLHLAASRAWPVHQMDVSNAFLHGHLQEQVYCQQPIGFVDTERPDDVCLLSRSLYGLKQAPRAWYQRIAGFLHQLGFRSTRSDASLFVYRTDNDMAYLLLYVDDIILMASTAGLLRQLTDSLRTEFTLKDLGPLHYFLGIEVVRRADGFFLHQRKYAHELLERAGMLNCNPAPTPVDTKAKLSASDGSLASDAPFYRSIIGALQYLTLARPELQYAVQQVCLHMHAPRDAHWATVKRILRYICGTMGYGLSLHASPSTSTDLVAYSDADWAGCPYTGRSTSGYYVYLGSSLVSWSSKRQPTVSRSSAEAEYRAVANAVAECTWLRQLLSELSCPVDKATVVFCDNMSAVYLSANPVHHRRTKHIELDIHFVREQVALGRIRRLFLRCSGVSTSAARLAQVHGADHALHGSHLRLRCCNADRFSALFVGPSLVVFSRTGPAGCGCTHGEGADRCFFAEVVHKVSPVIFPTLKVADKLHAEVATHGTGCCAALNVTVLCPSSVAAAAASLFHGGSGTFSGADGWAAASSWGASSAGISHGQSLWWWGTGGTGSSAAGSAPVCAVQCNGYRGVKAATCPCRLWAEWNLPGCGSSGPLPSAVGEASGSRWHSAASMRGWRCS